MPPVRGRNILIVGEGDPYLETALSYLPNTELYGTTPARYTRDVVRRDGSPWDLIIFEGFVPTTSCMYSMDLRYHWLLNDEKWCMDEFHCS